MWKNGNFYYIYIEGEDRRMKDEQITCCWNKFSGIVFVFIIWNMCMCKISA